MRGTLFLCDVCGRRPWAARPFDLWFVDCLTIVLPEDGLLPAVRANRFLAAPQCTGQHVAGARRVRNNCRQMALRTLKS